MKVQQINKSDITESEIGTEHTQSLQKKQLTLGILTLTIQDTPGPQPEEPSEGEHRDRNEEVVMRRKMSQKKWCQQFTSH